MDVQKVYDELVEISDKIKKLSEEKTQLLDVFYAEFEDYEFPIIDKDGKNKFFRVHEVDGRFVYNSKYEMGTRVKPLKEWNSKQG